MSAVAGRIGSDPPRKLLVTAEDAAALLSLGRSTVYQLIRAGRIPSVRVGRTRRIAFAALEAFVAELEQDFAEHV